MNYFCPGSVNTYWGPGPVNTNWGPGLVNTNWGPGLGAKQRAGGREIQIPVKIHEFSSVSDTDVEEFCFFFNAELKIPHHRSISLSFIMEL